MGENFIARSGGNFYQLLAQRGRAGAHRHLRPIYSQVRGEILAQRGGRYIRVAISLCGCLCHSRGCLWQGRVRGLIGGKLECVIIARTSDVGRDGFQVGANHRYHFRACAFAAGAKAGG